MVEDAGSRMQGDPYPIWAVGTKDHGGPDGVRIAPALVLLKTLI